MTLMTQEGANELLAKYRGKVNGIFNHRDRLWVIVHPTGIEVAFTDYNQEITGHTDGAENFPELGQFISYGGNAYYVVGEANRLGFITINGDNQCPS